MRRALRIHQKTGAHQPAPAPSAVDHPKHYNMGKIEAITAINDWKLGFELGNAVKYIARAEHKGNALQDLEKAAWYLNHEIQKRKQQTPQ
jgi:hypothetical protein